MRTKRQIEMIIVHCSATKPTADIGASAIDRWHKDRGWSGIGYHNVIRRNGWVENGRDMSQKGAHVKGFNSRSIGVCLIGGVDKSGRAENNFTDEQFHSLRLYLDWVLKMFPGAELLGHRDLSPDLNGDGIIDSWEFMKECPCFDVRAWYAKS